MKRVLTALVLIPAVLGLIFYGPVLLVRAAIALVAALCLHEALTLVEASGVRPFRALAFAGLILAIMTPAGLHLAFYVAFTLAALALCMEPSRQPQAWQTAGGTLLMLVYVGGPFALGRALYEVSPHFLLVALLVNWVGDSAAMYVGKAFGRRKLAPSVSPNKTWEGALASLALGATAGAGYLLWAQPAGVGPELAALLGVAGNIAGQFGDLAESALKRGAGVKDSGSLLPGHGGMLDRMDGALFSFPAVYFVLAANELVVSFGLPGL